MSHETTLTDAEIAETRARWGCDQMDKELDRHMEGATLMNETTRGISPAELRSHADNLSPSGNHWVCAVLKSAATEIERLNKIIATASKMENENDKP